MWIKLLRSSLRYKPEEDFEYQTIISRQKEMLSTYCHNVHPDQDFDGVVWWYPEQNLRLPSVHQAGIFRTFVDAERALRGHNYLFLL